MTKSKLCLNWGEYNLGSHSINAHHRMRNVFWGFTLPTKNWGWGVGSVYAQKNTLLSPKQPHPLPQYPFYYLIFHKQNICVHLNGHFHTIKAQTEIKNSAGKFPLFLYVKFRKLITHQRLYLCREANINCGLLMTQHPQLFKI